MRRRPGIQGLQAQQRSTAQYKRVGEDAAERGTGAVREQLATFKSSLEDFALKYRKEIQQDPVFRSKFHQMCATVGVDPLASRKGFWADVLGMGDFYYELGVQIVEACLANRGVTGGLMEVGDLLRAVRERRGSLGSEVSKDDALKAVDKLKVLGGGFGIVAVGDKMMVRSVPGELSPDHAALIDLAKGCGYVSESIAEAAMGWPRGRAATALKALMAGGMALADDGAPGGERLYWFPCVAPDLPGSSILGG